MPSSSKVRKALAVALSRVELSQETILRHAQTTLRAPELVEIPSRASALGLWTAVLQRAEAEATVRPLVESVLEENPAADSLKAALRSWLEWEASAAAARSPVSEAGRSDTLPGSSRTSPPARAPSRAARALRWGVLLVAGVVLVGQLVNWPSLLVAIGIEPARERDFEPTNGDLEAALLACWRGAQGASGEQAASTVWVRLGKRQPGESDEIERSGARLKNPRFKRCAAVACERLLSRMTPGRSIEARVTLADP
jgi:hypothetical protein